MKRGIFAVFDVVAGELFGPLILQPNEAAARRLFQDALTGSGSAMASHPEDYALFYVGELDSETGAVVQPSEWPFKSSLAIINGHDVLRILAARQQSEAEAEAALQEVGVHGD